MWGRVVEIMTAAWMVFSPFIFAGDHSETLLILNSLTALLIASLAALSYWPPTRYAHLGILIVATGMLIWGRFAELPPPPFQQNYIVVGLFLMMIAIIPNEASDPPRVWRKEVDHA
ncbi:hypothetical protein [Rosistilla oblonga]|uniref:hypothetical protein n=1 Tax=Rosistilla oblonga TaxID=2527990 RepID=UPI003A97ED09